MSIEQMCRDLLTQAIADGLVRPPKRESFTSGNPDPQARNAGDLAGMANKMTAILVDAIHRDRAARETRS